MITSFKAIPSILLEAGQVDGCSALTNLLRVALPLVTPGLVGAATVAFLFSWNEFFLALLLTNTSAVTAPVALYQLIGNLQLNIGELAAGGCIVVAPTVLVVAFFQKQLIEGLTLGSVQE
jgi:multiple sugar transport system permease protein